jgi:hypothetical protein
LWFGGWCFLGINIPSKLDALRSIHPSQRLFATAQSREFHGVCFASLSPPRVVQETVF